MRVLRKVRNEAILILAVCASNQVGTLKACEWLGIDGGSESNKLITLAFRPALNAWSKWLGPHRKPRPVYAEAESMLRTGWKP